MGYANSTTGLAPSAPSLSNAIESLDPAISRAESYTERLRQLSEKLHGPRPEPVRADGRPDKPPPPALISSIHDRRERLVNTLDSMEAAINSLESGF